uniref:Polysacc_synt_4 domain-containing protein n=1 Tax=Strongyloides papillosus TaxID=174720 RepID=A0A0N5BKU5_STREA
MADLVTQLTAPPEDYINDPSIELAWAMKASERASIHQNLLLSCDTKTLKLNKNQDDIYKSFREIFPDLNIEMVTEEQLKGDNKKKWHDFCESFKEIDEYNMGALLRMDVKTIYSPDNTIIVPRIQFLAIEAARNIEGLNDKYKESISRDYQKASSDGTLAI